MATRRELFVWGITCGTLLATNFATHAEEWNRFRGPNGSAVSSAQNLPAEWSETENVKWKVPLPGPGSSSPILVGDKLFLTYYTGYGADRSSPGNPQDLTRHLMCVSQADGKTLGDRAVPAESSVDRFNGFLRDHGYTTPTPASDGERVYAFFGKAGVVAFDLEGQQLWQTNVGNGSARNGWGSGSSPMLYKNMVIITAGAESQALVALDKMTGSQVWTSKAENLHGSWSTPVLVEVPGATVGEASHTELVISAPYEIWGFDPEKGKFLWYADGVADDTICGSLVARDGIVYAVGGRSGSAVAVRAGGKDDVTKTHTLWKGAMGSYVPSPVLAGNRIFTVNERGILGCLNATNGEKIFQQRLDAGGVYASPIVADGRVYIVTRTSGTIVLSSTGDGEVLAQNRFDDQTDFNASPAVAEGRLFLRSNQALYCVGK